MANSERAGGGSSSDSGMMRSYDDVSRDSFLSRVLVTTALASLVNPWQRPSSASAAGMWLNHALYSCPSMMDETLPWMLILNHEGRVVN